MNTYHIHTACMSPALKGSSALECFEGGNVIEIRNGIMFDFYTGLPHIVFNIWLCGTRNAMYTLYMLWNAMEL